MRMLYKIAAYLTLLLGIGHTSFTPAFYNELSSDALWFAGAGLTLVYLGLVNIFAEKMAKKWMLNVSIATNVVGGIWAVLLAVSLDFVPQSIVGLLFFAGIILGSVLVRTKT